MINFYCLQIDRNDCESNTWYEINDKHYFKLPVTFQGYAFGTPLRMQDLYDNKTYPQSGFFLPDETFYVYFITDFSNNSIELMTNLYSSHDILFETHGDLMAYYYKIPWYFIPKNYLDFQPKHLIMMYNMGYLMQMNPNNNQINNQQYYNKYYHGIEISQQDIESSYAKFMMEKFSLDSIIVKDYLNF